MPRTEVSQTVLVHVTFYDGSALVTGLTPVLSIQRESDDEFWNGTIWAAAYATVAMTELTGNDGLQGKYEYDFGTPNANVYRFRVRQTIAGRLQVKELSLQVFEDYVTAGQTIAVAGGIANSNLKQITDSAVAAGRMRDTIDAIPRFTASGTPTVNNMESDATEADGILEGRTIIWIEGAAKFQQAEVKTYVNALGKFTFKKAVAVAPSSGDDFIIV